MVPSRQNFRSLSYFCVRLAPRTSDERWCDLLRRWGRPRRRSVHDWSSDTHPGSQRTRRNPRWKHHDLGPGHTSARDLGPRDRGICPNRTGPVGGRLGRLSRLRRGLSQLRLGRLRRGLAQTLLWRRGTCGRSCRRPRARDARGQHRILLWLRVWLLPVLLRLSRVQLRLLPVLLLCTSLLRVLPVPARLLSAGLLPPGLLSAGGVWGPPLFAGGFFPPPLFFG